MFRFKRPALLIGALVLRNEFQHKKETIRFYSPLELRLRNVDVAGPKVKDIPTLKEIRNRNYQSTTWLIWKYVKPQMGLVTAIVVITLGSACINIYTPIVIGKLATIIQTGNMAIQTPASHLLM